MNWTAREAPEQSRGVCADEKAGEYQRRGNDAAQAITATGSHTDDVELEAFEQLKVVRQMLQAHSRSAPNINNKTPARLLNP